MALSTGKRYVEPGDTVSGPQIEGICKADRVDVLLYTHDGGDHISGTPDVVDLGYESTITDVDLDVVGYDRFAKVAYNMSKTRQYKWCMASAYAYTQGDKELFTVSSGSNRTEPILSLNGNKTPELYYGVLSGGDGHDNNNGNTVEVGLKGDELFYYYTVVMSHGVTFPLKGRIFRIVSQINLEVTEVEKSLVKSMELLANNIPTQITLYGTHGTNYPVTACKEEGNTSGATMVSLDKVSFEDEDETGDATVVLSSFFLPSEVGMKLQLRVNYRQEIDSEGNTSKVYDLQPARSYYLTGDDAEVYNVDEGLKNGNDLYVYDGRNYCFYSYANVRVNLSGHFENFATDTGDAEITIEVEPNFEKVHNYEIAN